MTSVLELVILESSNVEACLVTCNSKADCGAFWVNWDSCYILNKTICQDVNNKRPAASEVTYYVKI